MALPASLSEKGLIRFRTKLCERILATGTCSFADKCQYSHAKVARRNPKKFLYSYQRCPEADRCPRGDKCDMAHTKEEELFHPDIYKTRLCPGHPDCGGYYCPFAHSEEELKKTGASIEKRDETSPDVPSCVSHEEGNAAHIPIQPGMLLPGIVKSDAEYQSKKLAEPATERWWQAGEQGDLLVSLQDVVPGFSGLGDELAGGVVRPGRFFRSDSKGKLSGKEVACHVKLLPTTRRDSSLANQVVKETKRWMSHSPASALLLRRTVATTVLAFSGSERCLKNSQEALLAQGFSVQQMVEKPWLTATAAQWLRQLLSNVSALHRDGIAHLCLSPANVMVGLNGELRTGDFLGKVKAWRYLQHGWRTKDEAWAMWHPPEVHHHVGTIHAAAAETRTCAAKGGPQEFAVDVWQLGVVIFYLLTGRHPFGDTKDAASVCSNIVNDRRVNWSQLAPLPLFADLVGRLLTYKAEERLTPPQALAHPLLWCLDDAVSFAGPLVLKDSAAGQLAAKHSWLRHVPALAPFASALYSRDPPPPWLSKLCERAVRGDPVSSLLSVEAAEAESPPEAWAGPLDRPPAGLAEAADMFCAGAAAGAAAAAAAAARLEAPQVPSKTLLPGLAPPPGLAAPSASSGLLPGVVSPAAAAAAVAAAAAAAATVGGPPFNFNQWPQADPLQRGLAQASAQFPGQAPTTEAVVNWLRLLRGSEGSPYLQLPEYLLSPNHGLASTISAQLEQQLHWYQYAQPQMSHVQCLQTRPPSMPLPHQPPPPIPPPTGQETLYSPHPAEPQPPTSPPMCPASAPLLATQPPTDPLTPQGKESTARSEMDSAEKQQKISSIEAKLDRLLYLLEEVDTKAAGETVEPTSEDRDANMCYLPADLLRAMEGQASSSSSAPRNCRI